MKKDKFLIALGIIIVVAAVILRLIPEEKKDVAPGTTNEKSQPTVVGNPVVPPVGESDVSREDCGADGYFWCGLKEKCIALQDENCEVTAASTSEIAIFSPTAGEIVTSPLVVTGTALGNWFFEANLPIKLLDENGDIILAHFGTAQDDWMTTGFVPFAGELTFTTTSTAGYLLISKDNPSALPQNDAAIKIPIRFK